MKLRAIIVAVSMTAIGASLMHCGSDDADPAKPDGGASSSSSSSTSGFLSPDSASGSSSSGGISGSCTPTTCAGIGATCGPQGDGCGGVIECGTCTQGKETCGGGGTPSVCGGAAKCIPQTCTDLKFTCGPAGDGCGGPLQCGTCQEPQICGGGGLGKCGGGIIGLDGGLYYADGGACQPRTACGASECGFVANGCGGVIECGMCGPGEICGLNAPSVCAKPTCTKTTCTAQGANCGFAGDGCGGLLDCGGPNICAAAGQICGGGGPNKCGSGGPDGGAGCVNFCVDQQQNDTCAPGQRTKISGTVFAPNGKLPLPDAVVFIPNGSKTFPYGLGSFVDGVASGVCEQCALQSLGTPLLATKAKSDGTFTLDNVPAGVDFPLVIQLGRWRRVVTIPARTACSNTALTPDQTRFAKKQNEGSQRDSIPLLAISTGSVDGLECVLYKLGIDKVEFTNPAGIPGGGGGRIRLYRDNSTVSAKPGAKIDDQTPFTDAALTNSAASLNQYDAVIFGCPGGENDRNEFIDDRVRAYANRGGRVYATHFNYVYLYDRTPWDLVVPWRTINPPNFPTVDGRINTSFPKGQTFAQWLGTPLNATTGEGVGALKSASPPTVALKEVRGDAQLPIAPAGQAWITQNTGADPQPPNTPLFHFTFNAPYGAEPKDQCGRVLFSDFHVSVGNTENQIFPAECGGATPPPLTDQEKILAFFLFDLTSCITPDVPPPLPTCKKLTCADQGIECGKAGDGCGGDIDCKPCPVAGQLCIGTPGKCVLPACTATSCVAQGAECGRISNGCGLALTCPPCDAGLTCGGSGPNKCGKNECSPKTCIEQSLGCGPAGDGCGNPIDCGPCPTGQTCGGGGVPNVCGAPSCTKRTCAQANANCGPVADGCGGLVQCGICVSGQVCGIETPSRCGKPGPD